jgi:Ca2+-binding EF-hand superfamily protein
MMITGVLLVLGACQRNERVGAGEPAAADFEPTPAAQPSTEGARASADPAQATTLQLGRLATCRPGAQLSTALERLVEFADPNSDGSVTREEAASAANFLVGGFFFRSDENGDGTVTPEEGRQARKELLERQPAVAGLLREAQKAGGIKPFAAVGELLDVEYTKPVTAEAARSAARDAAAELVALADENRDGKVTMGEARSASWKGVQALGKNVFKSMDSDGDGKLSEQEFHKALSTPAEVAFQLADGNNDGSLTQAEASSAMAQVAGQLGLPNRASSVER